MSWNKIPMHLILVENSHYQSNKLRKRLLEEGYKEPICESCFNEYWLDGPIPLELEHIDGNNSNNKLSNLALLCPNCHALTSTYRGKNKNNAVNKHYYARVAERQTRST